MKVRKIILGGFLLTVGLLGTQGQITKAAVDPDASANQVDKTQIVENQTTDTNTNTANNSNEAVTSSSAQSSTTASSQTSNNQNEVNSFNKSNSGWKIEQNQHVYWQNGQKLTGLHQIEQSTYLFSPRGYVLTGVRRIPQRSIYGYFNKQGQRQTKNTKTPKAYYWINHRGTITGIKNNAKAISQRPNMPTGCEITAVTMMLNFAGVHVTKEKAARLMKHSSNPNKGFIGSPYKKYPGGYWVAPNGIKSVVKHYLGHAQVMTGCSLKAIKKKLLSSHLVVVWVRYLDGFFNHALTLTGYHQGRLYFNDPWTGTKRSISEKAFILHWVLNARRALSY